jgi:outer membrane protein TolC
LALKAQSEAVRQSRATFEVSAATSEAAAIRTLRYPQIRPIASVNAEGETNFALGAQQQIWDFGRIRAQKDEADTAVDVAEVRYWIELNEAVFTALDAYLDVQVSRTRLTEYGTLLSFLKQLEGRVQERSSGGVAGRSEAIDLSVALQKAERAVLNEEVAVLNAERLLRESVGPASGNVRADTLATAGDCLSVGSGAQAPELVIARLEIVRARYRLDGVRARRFPAIVGSASIDQTGTTSAGLSLDASDLLSWDRPARLAAAEQAVNGAIQNYNVLQRSIARDLGELTAERSNQAAILPRLAALARSAEENQSVFWDLFDSGQVQITEGIQLAEEVGASRMAVSDLSVEMIRSCIRIARIRGALTEFVDVAE